MPLVMSRGGKDTTFRRNVRDERGAIVRTLAFPNGEPVDVSWDDLPIIQNDLHKALVPVRVGSTGKATVISADEYAEIMKVNAEEAATDPAASSASEATESPDQGASNGAKPARRSR